MCQTVISQLVKAIYTKCVASVQYYNHHCFLARPTIILGCRHPCIVSSILFFLYLANTFIGNGLLFFFEDRYLLMKKKNRAIELPLFIWINSLEVLEWDYSIKEENHNWKFHRFHWYLSKPDIPNKLSKWIHKIAFKSFALSLELNFFHITVDIFIYTLFSN